MPFLTCRSHGALTGSTFRARRSAVQPQFNHEGPRGVRLNVLAHPSGPAFEARQTAASISSVPKDAGALQNNSVVFDREGAGSGRVPVKHLIESFERGSHAEAASCASPLAALPSQAAAAAATAGAAHEEATALAIDALALAFGALSIAVGDDVALPPAAAPAAAAEPAAMPAAQVAAAEPATVMATVAVAADPLQEVAAAVASPPEVVPAAEPATQTPKKAAPADNKRWREQWAGFAEGYEAAKAAVVGLAVVAAEGMAGMLKGEHTKAPQATPLATASGVEVWGAAALKLAPMAQLMSSMRRTVAAVLLRGLAAPTSGAASKYDPLFHLHKALTSGQGKGLGGSPFALPASLALPVPRGRSKFDPMSDLLGAVDAVSALVSALDTPPANSIARASSKYDPMVELLGALHAFVSAPPRMRPATAT